MNTPHYTCTHCGSDNTEYRGPQKSVEPDTLRYYEYPCCQCNGCGTSFGVISEKTYTGRVFGEAKVTAL